MGDATLSVLASSQAAEAGGNNFLVPNGTFFFVLAIFLIVLGVIGTFVVPPILKVLRERDAMVAKTAADNKKSAEQFDAAQADYEEAMKEARVQASSFRDNARAEGRKVVDDARARAEQAGDVDVAAGRRAIEAGEGRRGIGSARQRGHHVGDAGQSDPRRRRHPLSRDEGSPTMSTFIGQLIGFAAIVLLVVRYVVPPVRELDDRPSGHRASTVERFGEGRRAAHRVDYGPQQGRGSRQVGSRAGRRRGQGGRGTHHRTATGPGRDRGGAHQGTGRAARPNCCGHS